MIKIIALLDKKFPPNHSFINGMLATSLPKEKNMSVNLIVTKNFFYKKEVCRYKMASCLSKLYPRKHFYRVLNFFKIIFLLKKLIKKNQKNQIVLFVRNDPIFLLACAFIKKKKSQLIFQSSFPHESVSGSFFKRFLAKMILKLSKRKVDGLLAVSPRGLARLKKLMPNVKKLKFIPLLSDQNNKVINFRDINKNEKIKFIYVGDHSKLRKLEIVLRAIILSINNGILAEFYFVGGDSKDILRLSKIPGVEELVNKRVLKFIQKIPRDRLKYWYANFDVGLSLIPPDNHYLEASPTKLTEYMGAGLAVIASKGIELQEEIVKKSKGGLLCDWTEGSIAENLINISVNKKELVKMRKNGNLYSRENLNYENYINVFRELIN